MKNVLNKSDSKTKKPYEKPTVRIVKIADGQQTLNVGCKMTSAGQSSIGANPCYPGNFCTAAGS